jgi:hypothetical protein
MAKNKPDAPAGVPTPKQLKDLLDEFRGYFGDAAFDKKTGRPKAQNWSRRLREAREKHAGGRPPLDPADVRSERIGVRIHPDLRGEMNRLARIDGLRLSMFIERSLIKVVNERSGAEVLDLIGRYKGGKAPRR